MLVDVHCHLEMAENLGELIAECVSVNVKKIVSCSVDLASMKQNLEIKRKFSEVECCLGIHPSDCLSMAKKEINDSIGFVQQNISLIKGIGEIGIDFKHALTEPQKEKQINLYKTQLELAEKNSLPAVIHSRFAEKKSLEILSSFSGKVLLHWFDGNNQAILEGINRNYFFSVGPAVIYNQDYLKKALSIPLENLLLETDSPVMFGGEKAKPFWVKKVAEKLSVESGTELKEIEKKTSANSKKFFGF